MTGAGRDGVSLKPAAARVRAALAAHGLDREVIELPVEARTSQQAADAVGVSVAQIAKSLVWSVEGEPIMVIASGANRVDESRLAVLAGGRVRRASPELVREATGYVIGGVAPVGYPRPLRTWIDRDLLGHERIYAAAGLPECVFPLSPAELVGITGGRVVDIAAPPGGAGDGRATARVPVGGDGRATARVPVGGDGRATARVPGD